MSQPAKDFYVPTCMFFGCLTIQNCLFGYRTHGAVFVTLMAQKDSEKLFMAGSDSPRRFVAHLTLPLEEVCQWHWP